MEHISREDAAYRKLHVAGERLEKAKKKAESAFAALQKAEHEAEIARSEWMEARKNL